MARLAILGNGSLTVGIDEHGFVHDFYYPYVGLENLTTARSQGHKIGVWVEDRFSWLDTPEWQCSVSIDTDALIAHVTWESTELELKVSSTDFVDSDHNIFFRRLNLANMANRDRELRLFMHQVFEISQNGRADTALFVPEDNYILDYKGRCSLLVYAQSANGEPFDQYSVGNQGIEGKEGTFRDAEDGELANSTVEHGGVDSTLRLVASVQAKQACNFEYWVVAADSQQNAEKIHSRVLKVDVQEHLADTTKAWKEWLDISAEERMHIPEKYQDFCTRSLLLIKAHCDRRGGIIASCDSSIYNYGRDYYSYVWPRDGAYAIWPLIRLGYKHEAKQFFNFCRDILTKDGYLEHKFQPDRAIGSTWHPLLHGKRRELAIQEDETAIVLYMLGEFFTHFQEEREYVQNLYATFIQPMANFMADYIDAETHLPHASYDLWEQKFLTHTYTVSVVYQALVTAADFADHFEFPDDAVHWRLVADKIRHGFSIFYNPDQKAFRKGFILQDDKSLQFDNTLDISSLFGAVMFGAVPKDSAMAQAALREVENILLHQTPAGGAVRYEHDDYFLADQSYVGNPWFVTTLWMAQYYLRIKDVQNAHDLVDWAVSHALESGVLSEQVDPVHGTPVSVTPLVWSHAEFINTALDLGKLINR
jgi:GH15 family glucan-1,4-alpha-glucosidase